MKSIQLIGDAIIGQQTTLNVVDAILLSSKVKKVRDVILKNNDDGSIKQFYGRLNDEEMISIMDICIFIDNITSQLGVDFEESKSSLFGEGSKNAV